MPTTTRTREYRLSGTLDLVSVDRLADALSMALGASGDVVIDLSKVESIDSFVVRFLLEFSGVLDDGSVVLHSANPQVERILRVMGVGRRPGPLCLAANHAL